MNVLAETSSSELGTNIWCLQNDTCFLSSLCPFCLPCALKCWPSALACLKCSQGIFKTSVFTGQNTLLKDFDMSTTADNGLLNHQATAHTKPLWAAVGILGTAVLAMGGVMLYQGRSVVPTVQLAAATAPTAFTSEISRPTGSASKPGTGWGSVNLADDMVEKSTHQNAKPAPVPAKKVVKPVVRPAAAQASGAAGVAPALAPVLAPVPAVAAAAPVCGNCGAVESVRAIQRTTKADGPGVGAVAGGVAGAVLGHQVGNGNGRTVATILGAIGGGFAGNAIEKNLKKETIYQVGVRMDDGSRRTLEVAQPPLVGSRVTVDGSSLHGNDHASYRSAVPVVQNIQ